MAGTEHNGVTTSGENSVEAQRYHNICLWGGDMRAVGRETRGVATLPIIHAIRLPPRRQCVGIFCAKCACAYALSHARYRALSPPASPPGAAEGQPQLLSGSSWALGRGHGRWEHEHGRRLRGSRLSSPRHLSGSSHWFDPCLRRHSRLEAEP
jgi:hypothetical protein